jgi:nucleotide-binding universal stress UspA family protein
MTTPVTTNLEVTNREAEVSHPYNHILVALDGSGLAEQVLPYVVPLAKTFGARLTLLCAVEPLSTVATTGMSLPGSYVSYDPLIEAQDELRSYDATYLIGIKQRLAEQGIEVGCEEPEDRAAEAIVAAARRLHVDLIAMTTHGRSGLGRALLGSVADGVVRTAPCPVLLVRLSAPE